MRLRHPLLVASLACMSLTLGCDEADTTTRNLVDSGTPSTTVTREVNPVITNTSETAPGQVEMSPPTAADANAFEQAKLLQHGMNVGNFLDQPGQSSAGRRQCDNSKPAEGRGTSGMLMKGWMFEAIKQAGFDHVRLTVNWNCHTHAADGEPYKIDEEWLARVDWAVAHVLTRGMAMVIDMHNYWDYFNDPAGEKSKFVSIWTQLAEHYKNYPKGLFFELLNEPPYDFDDATLGNDLVDVISAIRASNPYRSIIYGGTDFNKDYTLTRLTQIPKDDPNLIATIHYYSPYCFTHPGQVWDCPSGHESSGQTVMWPDMFPQGETADASAKATAASLKAVDQAFANAAAIAEKLGRPIYNGEFGAHMKRDKVSRAAYVQAVARASEKYNMGWATWGFFKCEFDTWYSTVGWYPEIISALLPNYAGQ